MRRYQHPDGKSEIVELAWPTKDEIRQILQHGKIEFVTIRVQTENKVDFTARVIENELERKIKHSEYLELKGKIKEYDFAYDEIAHRIYRKSYSSMGLDKSSRRATILRCIANNNYPASAAEIALEVYGQDDKHSASLVRQQIQNIRIIHPDLIIKVPPKRRYVLNSELNTLFIFSD